MTTDSQALIFADGFESGDLSAWSGTGAKFFGLRGSDYTVRIKQTYVYGGKGGRVSQRDLDVIINDADAESFTQSWEYTDLGDVETIGSPRCTFPECSGAAASPRTINFGYTRGYLTSVEGYASLIQFHPSGLVSQIAHTNGITVTQAADPHGMIRPASITAKFGTTTRWTTGSYSYDGSGNVTAMGTSWFLYDPDRDYDGHFELHALVDNTDPFCKSRIIELEVDDDGDGKYERLLRDEEAREYYRRLTTQDSVK